MGAIVKISDLVKYYYVGENVVKAVDHTNLEIERGKFTAIVGRSGSGKSTLLMNVTSGYHYHTIRAKSGEQLDEIQKPLSALGFLAKLQDYEPVDFKKKAE